MGRKRQKEPTQLQYKIYEYIYVYVQSNGYGPLLSEIATDNGILKQSAWTICNELERKGYITKLDGVARTIMPIYED